MSLYVSVAGAVVRWSLRCDAEVGLAWLGSALRRVACWRAMEPDRETQSKAKHRKTTRRRVLLLLPPLPLRSFFLWIQCLFQHRQLIPHSWRKNLRWTNQNEDTGHSLLCQNGCWLIALLFPFQESIPSVFEIRHVWPYNRWFCLSRWPTHKQGRTRPAT